DLPAAPVLETRTKVETVLRDRSLRVRVQAMLALARLGDVDTARAQLTAALRERDVNVRVAALAAYAACARYFDGHDDQRAADAAPVVRLLADTLSVVRLHACRALAAFHDPDSAQALVTRLHDAVPAVRSAAAESLRQRGAAVTPYVVNVLDSEFEAARDAALDALSPGSVDASEPLRRYARQEIARLREVRSQVASLAAGGRAVRFLCESLQHEVQRGEARLVKIVGLIGDPRAMQLVQKSLRGADSEVRSAALEALETLGDKALAREIITLLEQEPPRLATDIVISQVMRDGDRWERSLAARAVPELGLKHFEDRLHDLKFNPDPLIAETAAEALVRLEDVRPMDTLQTVSTLERVLLLRDIPIFSDLSPEDLQQVAAIAVEQWYPKDTTIFHQEDPGDMMFVIVDGHVQVVRTINGAEQVLAQRGPGDFVGEMAIIESAPRSASLVTLEDVRMLAIDAETFKGILRERPEVSLAVLRSLSRRLRDLGK
ncbi:MAG: cyclic nucleotide-binding domain-containing protein, partial [Anaerolineae bacterium]